MTTDQIILKAICDHSPEWTADYVVDELDPPYIALGQIGSQILENVAMGKYPDRAKAVFATVEQLLVTFQKDQDAIALIGGGFFEGMQRPTQNGKNPDAVLSWMGPRSKEVFANFLEGWAGAGIRTLGHLQRRFLWGIILEMEIQIAGEKNVIQVKATKGSWLGLPHLLFEKRIGKLEEIQMEAYMGFAQPHANIELKFANFPEHQNIVVGNRVIDSFTDRFAIYEGQLLVINLEKYLAQILE